MKIVPTWSQNLSKIDPSGGHLGATLEARCFQDFIFDDFGFVLGPPLGQIWAHLGHHVFDVFFKMASGRRFHRYGLHFGTILEAKTQT